MIVYLDASALVKRYVAEAGSADVGALIQGADAIGTALVSRVEVAAAFAKATRMKVVTKRDGAAALRVFTDEWESLIRLHVTEPVIARAAALAWAHGLRGYDATHLAAALSWQDYLGARVTMATYDRQLWRAAEETGLSVWPEGLA